MNPILSARDLFAHMEWADAVVWHAVFAAPAAAADKRCLELLQHYTLTQRAFFDLWRHREFDRQALGAAASADLAQTFVLHRRYFGELFAWLSQVGEEPQGETLVVPWAAMLEQKLGRTPVPVSVGESMVQVAMHSAHHRGQLNARLRELGCEPPLVDFIAWAWIGKPAAGWPEPQPAAR